MPKFEKILSENMEFLNSITNQAKEKDNRIQISTYNPIKGEMNITPVIAEMLRDSKLPLCHSLPKVVDMNVPLVFRKY